MITGEVVASEDRAAFDIIKQQLAEAYGFDTPQYHPGYFTGHYPQLSQGPSSGYRAWRICPARADVSRRAAAEILGQSYSVHRGQAPPLERLWPSPST